MADHDVLDRLKTALQERYTIEREIGRGGMAAVYLAQDLKHERQVAVKVLRPELAASIGADRFLQEVKIAANLTHPHILPLHDSGEADGFLYYVMPYIEGESLRDKLAREGELPIVDAVRILREVVDALAHAHAHGVVHRDIKPDNVMLSGRHALVTDFGVAKAVSEATGRQQLTTEGVALGTPTYMAPEQAAADPHIDHRADIYAVGAVAYELLTGRPPFMGTTPQMILSAHLTDTPEPVTKYRESVPPALAQLVMKCLEKKAADRWQTAEELLPQLEALATPSGGTTPVGTMPVAAAKRGWKVAAATGVVAVVLAVVLVVTLLPRGSSVGLNPNQVVVAVFRNATDDPSLDQLGELAGHWITQRLQQAGVVPTTPWDLALSSSRYVQREVVAGRVRDPVHELALETGSAVVVSGAVYLEGDSLRIQTDVTDAARGSSLGSPAPVSGSRDAQQAVIETLGQQVIGFLAVSFDERLGSVRPSGHPTTLEAYQVFDEGLTLYTQSRYEDAAAPLQRAYQLDTTFTLPLLYAAAAQYNSNMSVQGDSTIRILSRHRSHLSAYELAWLDSYEAYRRGDIVADYEANCRAAELAPGSKMVYNCALTALRNMNRPQEALDALLTLDPERGAMRGWVPYWDILVDALHRLGEHERELAMARRARELYPRVCRSLVLEGYALAALGRVEKVLEAVDEAISVEGCVESFLVGRIGFELNAHGKPETAREVYERALNWYQGVPPDERGEAHGYYLYYAGRLDEAEAVFRTRNDRYWLAFVAARRGQPDEARELLQQLESEGGGSLFLAGGMAAMFGERQKAVELLTRYSDEVSAPFTRGLFHDPDFVSLHDYPPWQELIRPKG